MKSIPEIERKANLVARMIANEMQLKDILVRVCYRKDNTPSPWE